MGRLKGYIRWFDKIGNNGILSCLETGDEYYFNSYSDEETVYVVSGTCKKTGLQKTIETRYFPGLFLNYTLKAGSQTESWTYGTPVTFTQAKGIEQRWAIKIKIDESLRSRVEEHFFICALDALLSCELQDSILSEIRYPYAVKRLELLLLRKAA